MCKCKLMLIAIIIMSALTIASAHFGSNAGSLLFGSITTIVAITFGKEVEKDE